MAGFRKPKPQQAALKFGIYGPSGSGKTFTSMLLAEGLAATGGKRVALVDTEFGADFYVQAVPARRVHPEAFDVDVLNTRSLTEVLAAVRDLSPDEYGVVIIDSITHLWEAARAAYEGRQTRAGTIPMHAWAQIKKPYKELMAALLSSPMHVIFCGRQGNEYAEDAETEELKCVGVKMKAEGETPYEPHILIRMEPRKSKHGEAQIYAFFEKDRTGILAGKSIKEPNFDSVCKPLLPLLGGTQAKVETEEEVGMRDAEALESADRERAKHSAETLRQFCARIDLAQTKAELDAIGKTITPEVKKSMLPAHVTELRQKYGDAGRRVTGERTLEAADVA